MSKQNNKKENGMAEVKWVKVSKGEIDRWRLSGTDNLLVEILLKYRGVELYKQETVFNRRTGNWVVPNKSQGYYRVVYKEAGVKKETFLTENGEYLRGDKPDFDKPNSIVDGMREICRRILSNPLNILLKEDQALALAKSYANKPLGRLLKLQHAPKVFIQLDSGAPTYRVISKAYHSTLPTNGIVAYDFTFDMTGDVIKGNDDKILNDITKGGTFKSATKKVLAKGQSKQRPTTKER